MELPKAISAVLFYQAEPMSIKRLASALKRPEGEVKEALATLEKSLVETGLCLVRKGDEVTLGTRPEASELIEQMTKEELSRDLSKASLETFSIVLYKGPVTRSEIDYIRGVNSTFILRNLLIRGLIEKIDNPKDQRSYLYQPTFQLLEYMGVSKIEDLPEYASAMASLESFIAAKAEEVGEGALPAQTREEESSGGQVFAQASADETLSPKTGEQVSADEEDADVAEENEAAENYDDPELHSHTDKDRSIGI
ncbi:MAG: SMC-Scp complex subunit ScpB [Candidatus Lloydbacteria bacterium RIFCSPHIGHO2_02_FULL_54_17]|uniref:SMC-Scp complex subunit ScpB n=1 Tax=Candidatus Lloydbacteria bacterium RIFCSPHIGHO2_02_FULL_54_17 TaxID=1798664 RepID=A0A1G2DG69_9BACT|nr:MAG: SMC-Scp complex subunit ScpB [Candidatus Lloydbacteria bacterium RIFCSPHIGHO2_01_FULL_54_11]OGZ12657.1 MAG: SMC-Scp complex subunit ScpB [Candidatus Lloydbacteria bacterium RIFCSPHIGHO2_02_FULL_54_17]OGZ13509.1 MAG: SMC-Scp complex subunit ScpB [Candidatus Lloydbacteria bacterium RIFCSPLOWO2_01_FULL_54_18]OGZ16181.1 MAG: SMC-Scp complex subunit ScpB [Candidatus Lloydbacteria bacterium RIFCSPLOWO2_02_FULL_54_12]